MLGPLTESFTVQNTWQFHSPLSCLVPLFMPIIVQTKQGPLKRWCHDFPPSKTWLSGIMIILGGRFFPKKYTERVKIGFLCGHTPSSLSMHGCHGGWWPSWVSHTPQCWVNGKRGGVDYMMSFNLCFPTGPFEAQSFSFQEETKNTQGRQIFTL